MAESNASPLVKNVLYCGSKDGRVTHEKPGERVSKRGRDSGSRTSLPAVSQTSPSVYCKWEGGKVELTVHISDGSRPL